jgi:ElaB/YqjD/DUF883 family membrane-anchored ribosome-binding protein
MTDIAELKNTFDELRTVLQGRWNELTHEDLENLRAKAARLTDLVQERYGLTYEDARQQVQDFRANVGQHLSDSYDALSENVRQSASEFASDVRDFGLATTLVDVARHNPLYAMGTAFVVGFLLKAAMTPSRRSRWH